MSRRASREWNLVSAPAVSFAFLLAFFFGGLWVGPLEVEYRVFGLVDALAALLILYVLLNTQVLSWPRDAFGGFVLLYAGIATAQLVGLLLPPPGVIEWFVLAVLIIFAWGASFGVHRTRIVLGLGLASVALAALRYSVLPFIWASTRLPETPVVNLRSLGESFKTLLVAYEPSRPITQFYALLAILAWAGAVWLQWPPPADDDWIRQLPRSERDRLLYWLLNQDTAARGRGLEAEEVRGYLDRR